MKGVATKTKLRTGFGAVCLEEEKTAETFGLPNAIQRCHRGGAGGDLQKEQRTIKLGVFMEAEGPPRRQEQKKPSSK